MQEVEYVKGPRILENGLNLDADFQGGHFEVVHRSIIDPVSDGSLGTSEYHVGQFNKDGSLI